jgi:O-methyltransferase
MTLTKWYHHLPVLRRLYTERAVLRERVAALEAGCSALGEPRGPFVQTASAPAPSGHNDAAKRYLDLLELCLCNLIYRDGHRGMGVERAFDAELRDKGQDWPQVAHTMIGRVRLSHLRRSVERVLEEAIPGDFIETGVWRGGACIMMRGVLAAHSVTDRVVHLADSFCGLPPPDSARYPADKDLILHEHAELAVPRAEVEEAFRRYGLLDGQVRFHEGWFKETLPRLGEECFALIRLDGDMYESTSTALTELYPRLSPGGFAVIDDYGCFEACRLAVEDYRARHRIIEPIEQIDWGGVFWRKPR